MKEEYYLGKKISEFNIYEQRFRKAMQLMRIGKMLHNAEKTQVELPQNGSL